MSLLPLYAMAATHRTLTCQLNGMLAIMDETGMKVRIKSATFSDQSDSIAGQCLTVGDEMIARYKRDNKAIVGYGIARTLQNLYDLKLLQSIQPLLSYFDASLAYFTGILYSLSGIVMSQFMAQCNPPEFHLKDVVTCACNDTILSIPSTRSSETHKDYALWCSGTLGMIDGVGNSFIVYNPYSYAEIQTKAMKMQEYVECASKSYACSPPSDPEFEYQGVTLINILTKCRENFSKKRWDPMAYVFFDETQWFRFKTKSIISKPPSDEIQSCLSAQAQSGSPNTPCVYLYLNQRESWDHYWGYERFIGTPLAHQIDGCLTFSGPAYTSQVFSDCSDGTTGGCQLQGHVWTPSSPNNVPVGDTHAVFYKGRQVDSLIYKLYNQAHDEVLFAIEDAEQKWQVMNEDVDVQIFSAEGDVIHQIMDCIFLGPYSRVDYWPTPSCTSEEECLSGPYWSRDDFSGASRSVDSHTCPPTLNIPFTCGSPARKSLIRYFVKRVLSEPNTNGTIFQQAVLAQMRSMKNLWANQSLYGCLCEDQAYSHSCCASNSSFLPNPLNVEFRDLSSDHVLSVLEDEFDDLYERAMQTRDAWTVFMPDIDVNELPKYNWSQSPRVSDEARFSPKSPVYSYTPEEANSPFLTMESTLWGTCHAALKQVFWTLPMDRDNGLDPSIEAYQGDPSKLEEYIKKLTKSALEESPLFRHYHAKYTPSYSLLCAQNKSNLSNDGLLTFSSYTHSTESSQIEIMNGNFLPTLRTKDYRDGAIGWTQAIDYDLSPSWGWLDPIAQEQYLNKQNTIQASTEQILRYGRSGIRAGGMDTYNQINESLRETPLDFGRIPKCGPPPTLDDLSNIYMDKLFPMAQGVEDSAANIYCLRFILEVAKLEAIQLIQSESFLATEQSQIVSTWRRKCNAQIQLISLCMGLDLYRPPRPNIRVDLRPCPHFAQSQGMAHYTTPECLLWADGRFYDPCRCLNCSGDISFNLDIPQIKANPKCELRFDPRSIILDTPLGWWDGKPEPGLKPEFVDMILGDPDATGNTLNQHWATSEGPMESNSDFCDMISDYWPDEWDYPVGYHVSTPCLAEDTAYRSFHQAFGLYNGELRFQSDTLRDEKLASSHYGINGLCRANTFGLPTIDINPTRYCTSYPTSDVEDFSVYKTPPEITNWTDWACTVSSSELPWPGPKTSSLSSPPSLGLVPNLPNQGDEYYPSQDVDSAGPWDDIHTDQGWGLGCSNYALETCEADVNCPLNYRCMGRFCRDTQTHCGSTQECTNLNLGPCEGICMEKSVSCVRHSDCPAKQMCTGLGECVDPTISVLNQIDNASYAFQAYANDKCPADSRSFSLLGASYWGHVTTDILRIHGMCSYGDWYKYQQTLKNCASETFSDYIDIDPTTCSYIDLDSESQNTSKWWAVGSAKPDIFFMHPTNCDRDYERLKDFTPCAPGPVRVNDGTQAQFDNFYRSHTVNSNGKIRVPIAKMQDYTNAKYGFLGVTNITSDSTVNGLFTPCSDINQCSESPFTYQFKKVTRKRSTNLNYTQNDVFMCGAIGYWDGQSCQLDLTVLTLYSFLCVELASTSLKCKNAFVLDPTLLCREIKRSYPMGYAGVQTNIEAIRALWTAFITPDSLSSYLELTDCAVSFYNYNNDPSKLYRGSLYYPMDFILYEIPFSWFYQCAIVNTPNINPDVRYSQDCHAWDKRNNYRPETYQPAMADGDSGPVFLRNVFGIYTKDKLLTLQANASSNAAKLSQAQIDKIIAQYYGGVDLTYPRCSKNLMWDYDTFTLEYSSLIDAYYTPNVCHQGWVDNQVDILNSWGWPVQRSNWSMVLAKGDPNTMFKQSTYNGKTLLTLVKEELQRGISLSLADKIMGYNPGPNLPLVTRNQGVVLAQAPPPFYQSMIPTNLDPDFTPMNEGFLVPSSDTTQPRHCVYNKLSDDPLTRGYPPSSCSDDVGGPLKKCTSGGFTQYCTNAPLYQAINGEFDCGYHPEFPSNPCTNEGCGALLLEALYKKALETYPQVDDIFITASPYPWPEIQFSFALGTSLDYLGNIMPDKEKSVMCTINTDNLVDIMQCTNPHYLRLKRHVTERLTSPGFVIAKANSQLEWTVDRAFLNGGGIFAISNSLRGSDRSFLKGLFDDDVACKGASSSDLRVCWKRTSDPQWHSMNPWLEGYWNPFQLCDVEFTAAARGGVERVNAKCKSGACTADFVGNMPFAQTCDALYLTQVIKPSVPRFDNEGNSLNYNLCHVRLEEDQVGCLHDQTLLGGYDGMPVTAQGVNTMIQDTPYDGLSYSTSKDMYTSSSWEIPDDFRKSPSQGTNPLWQGDGAPFGYLRVDENDIGTHRIGFVIQLIENTTYSTLDVFRLPLTTLDDEKDLDAHDFQSIPVSQWIPLLKAELKLDSDNHVAKNPLYITSSLKPSCPLRRFAYYGGNGNYFKPTLPSSKRAAHAFRNITNGLYAHPTMAPVTDGQHLGIYTSSNGYCFCPVVAGVIQPQCQVHVTIGDTQCSLISTVDALITQSIQFSYVFEPRDKDLRPRPCTMQLDWPNIGGHMRDNTVVDGDFSKASDPVNAKCHVLDRLRPFRFKYKYVPTVKPDTNQGVCQTRRVSTLPDLTAKRCLRRSSSKTDSTLICDGELLTIPRKVPLTPEQTYLLTRTRPRTRCNKCSAPPKFTTQNGARMDPESSFGVPYRVSAERMLAKDLRDAICGNQTCDFLNKSSWRVKRFMETFMKRPWELFRNVSKPPKIPPKPPPSDAKRWVNQSWVYCPTREALITGQGCLGTIPKDEWRRGKTRICPRMIKMLSTNGSSDPMSTVPFCLIDNYTLALCTAIANARTKIIQANCIAAGNFSCLPTPWTYTPASYEPSNQEWVSRTVLSYYRSADSNVCPILNDEQALLEFNANFMKTCPANSINFFIKLMEMIRVIVRTIVLILSTALGMVVQMLALLFTGFEQGGGAMITEIKTQLIANYMWIKAQSKELMNTLVDLSMEMMMSSGNLGTGLMQFLTKACEGINKGYAWFKDGWCQYISKYLVRFFETLRRGFAMIATGFEILQDFMDEILGGILPVSFMAKYGAQNFAEKMAEKYSQPTERKTGKDAKVKVPIDATKNNKKISNSMKASKRIATTTLKAAGIAGMLLEAANAAYEIANMVRGMELYPENFTLFDFSDVLSGIDRVMEFLSTEETCLLLEVIQGRGLGYSLEYVKPLLRGGQEVVVSHGWNGVG